MLQKKERTPPLTRVPSNLTEGHSVFEYEQCQSTRISESLIRVQYDVMFAILQKS
jgi:hypothetical protein